MKLGIQFCPAVKAELHAKEAVLRCLRKQAKAAGKQVRGGPEGIAAPERCQDLRWLYATLQQMSQEFAAEIDEDLEMLKRDGADREVLVGHIYTVILCIRATNTIFFGDDR
jgi:hypothetical protein